MRKLSFLALHDRKTFFSARFTLITNSAKAQQHHPVLYMQCTSTTPRNFFIYLLERGYFFIFLLERGIFSMYLLERCSIFLAERLGNFLCDYSEKRSAGEAATARNYINVKNTLRCYSSRQTDREIKGTKQRGRSNGKKGTWNKEINSLID